MNGIWPAAGGVPREKWEDCTGYTGSCLALFFLFGHTEMMKKKKNEGQSRWLKMKLDTGQKFAVQVLYTGMKTHRIYTNDNLLVCFILQVGGKVSGRCLCVSVCVLLFLYLVS